jgi:hypothetical protein
MIEVAWPAPSRRAHVSQSATQKMFHDTFLTLRPPIRDEQPKITS